MRPAALSSVSFLYPAPTTFLYCVVVCRAHQRCNWKIPKLGVIQQHCFHVHTNSLLHVKCCKQAECGKHLLLNLLVLACRYSGILFMIAAIILAAAEHVAMIVIGRVFQGVAVTSLQDCLIAPCKRLQHWLHYCCVHTDQCECSDFPC